MKLEKKIETIILKQREFFNSESTIPYEFRIRQLKKLKAALNKFEPELIKALKKDLGK